MMQGDPRVDELMRPVNAAIRRHVKNRDAITEIYNRAYEAVMEVQDALNIAAAVTAKQIAENAKNLQLASRDALIERLIEAGNKLAEWIADMFTDNKVHNRDWHKWKDLIAEIRAGKGEG